MQECRGLDTFRTLLFFKLLVYHTEVINTEDIANCANFLTEGGKIGSDFYDLLQMVDPCRADTVRGHIEFVSACRSFTNTHSEIEMIKFFRVFWSVSKRSTNHVLCTSMLLGLLLADFYGPGVIVGATETRVFRSGIFTDRAGSYYDMMLAYAAYTPNLKLRLGSENGQSFTLFSQKALEKLSNEMVKLDGTRQFYDSMANAGIRMSNLIEHTTSKVGSIFWKSLFCPFQTSSVKYYFTIQMQRDTLEDTKLALILATHWIFARMSKDILKQRKFYVREKGIIIECEKEWDGIHKVYLTETHSSDDTEHFLYIQFISENGLFIRDMAVPIDDVHAILPHMLFEIDYTGIWFIFHVLGVWPQIVELFERAISEVEEEAKEPLRKWLSEMTELFTTMTFSYRDPIWWNYQLVTEDNAIAYMQAHNMIEKVKLGEKKVSIGRYVRRLPAGQQASWDARKLAAQCHIDLQDGYTLIDSFERSIPVYQKAETRDSAETNLFNSE